MSMTLAVNEQNDLYLTKAGNLATSFNLQAALEACAQAAKSQLAEMQYHVDRGLPNFQVVWSGHPSVAQFEAALRRELGKVTDVVDVPELSTTLVGERVVYTATIKTIFGTGAING